MVWNKNHFCDDLLTCNPFTIRKHYSGLEEKLCNVQWRQNTLNDHKMIPFLKEYYIVTCLLKLEELFQRYDMFSWKTQQHTTIKAFT